MLGQRWKDHLTRKATEAGAGMTVKALRKWIDEPSPMGLPKECANLIILVFAAQTNRSFFLHGAPYEPKLTDLPDDLELREEQLPSEAGWIVAIQRAGHIFGVGSSPPAQRFEPGQIGRRYPDQSRGGDRALPPTGHRAGEIVAGLRAGL